MRHVRRVFERVGLIQIDSVNVLCRSQELPLFARLGAHPRTVLADMTERGELFEYWAHEASLLPIEFFPLCHWRMQAALDGAAYRHLVELNRERPGYVAGVLQEVAARGPLTATELSNGGKRKGTWWSWSDGKAALEFLFWTGRVSARRRSNFEREYDLTERIIPSHVFDRAAVPEDEARRELLRRSARALGVATERDLTDYYRLNARKSRPRLHEVVEEGHLVPVEVEGWEEPAYLDPAARIPRRVAARALLSPFDSLVWDRGRTKRMFGFSYRIELYTPSPARVFGYYVLPFLVGEDVVGRVDVKADRAAGVLRVPAAFAEAGVAPGAVVRDLAEELWAMAHWLGLHGVAVGDRGDLAEPLAAAVG